MDRELRAAASGIARELHLECEVRQVVEFAASHFDGDCVNSVQRAAEMLGYPSRRIVSGAAHDAVYLSRVAPTSMIFVPCKDGISHNETEDARPEHLEAGANVLLHAVLARGRIVIAPLGRSKHENARPLVRCYRCQQPLFGCFERP